LLDRFQAQLVRCGANSNHWHLPASPCPICQIEQVIGLGLFVGGRSASANRDNPEFEADAFWAAIESVAAPPLRIAGPLPGTFRAMITAVPYPEPEQRTWFGRLFENIGLVAQSGGAERERRKKILIACRRRYDELAKDWLAHDPRALFQQWRAKLLSAREKLISLFRQRQQAISTAQQRLGLQGYLASHGITQPGIKGVGRSLTSTLLAHGIGSAADISAANLNAVPGIGPKRKAALIAWQNDLIRRYRPTGTVPALDDKTVQRIDSGPHAKIARLLATLRAGAASLRAIADREREKSSVDMQVLAAAAMAVAQAEADLNA
jgi:DNA-binding helix-hairpin-helix protein with protein kinase domain